ncbi:MAG: PD-(D/E)XK nuclease family protein [Bacteroidota bacterium]
MILSKTNIDKVDLEFLINEKITSSNIEQLLLVVPTNRKARNVKKEIISLMPNKSAQGINVETLGTLSAKLLIQSQPFRQLSEAAATIFIKQCAAELKLKYFSLYKREIPFGTLDRLKNIISEYKRHGVTPESLKAEAMQLTKSEKLKAEDIACIYDRYLKKCHGLNAFELGDVYQKVKELDKESVKKFFIKLYPSVDLIIINGFDEFTLPEQKIINRLSDVNNCRLFINFDYNRNNYYVFSHLDKCFDSFKDFGFKAVTDKSEDRLNRFSKIIRDYLFNSEKNFKMIKNSNQLFLIPAFNREDEVEKISKVIKNLIISEKVEPHKICVVFNLIQNYSSIVRDIFVKNGLPFNQTDRISLENSSPVIAVINFLEISENDFYYKNIFRALTSGYIDIGEVDFSNLLKVSAQLKIVSGKKNWISILNESILNIDYNSDLDEDEKFKKLLSYKSALNAITKLETILKPFESKLTIPDFQKTLFAFISRTNIITKLLTVPVNAEENTRSFATFIDTLNEIFDLLSEEHGSNKKFQLHFFMDQIRTACRWARFNVKEKSNYGVQVTTLEEIRGLKFDYLFIGGLCDGDLPTRFTPEVFHAPSFRKKAFTHHTNERNLFYQALLTWNKKLYLSYPETEAGRETVASTFLTDFTKLFEVTEINVESYQKAVTSIEELEVDIGKRALDLPGLLPEELSVELNIRSDEISRAISIDKLREENSLAESPFAGFLLADKERQISRNALEKLLTYANKQYSISQLENYARCPFKFFIERILNVESIEEPTEDIEAIEMGNILHNILFSFYSLISKQNIRLDSPAPELIKKCSEIIFEIADKKIERNTFKSPLTFYEREKIFGIDENRRESILNRFIEYESDNNKDFYPSFFEVRFGSTKDENSDEILSDSEPVKVDGIKLKGKIDRIDLSNADNSFSIVDYKLSGKKPTIRELKEGISLQLPVYLFAAQQLLKNKFNKEYFPDEMIIYSLKYSAEEFGKKPVSIKSFRDKEITTTEQLITSTVNHIKNYIEGISNGKFGLSPHDNREQLVCHYCRFQKVCRIIN